MRTVFSPPVDRHVSVLGFGCASLGSRVSASAGCRAVDAAFDAGVTWFDVAPPYGDGQAEALLGRALRGRRDRVVICTKFGIARPRISLAARVLRPAARRIVSMLPGTRALAGRGRQTGRIAAIDPAAIEPSLIESLRALRTDYVDVLALHDPSPQDAANPAIFDVLLRMVARGIVRAICVAGSTASVQSALTSRQPARIAQFPDSPVLGNLPGLRAHLADPLPFFVTHGVFAPDAAAAIARLPPPRHAALAALAAQYGVALPDLPLAYALANNFGGVVITSMFHRLHLDRNIRLAETSAPPTFAEEVRRVLLTNDQPLASACQ